MKQFTDENWDTFFHLWNIFHRWNFTGTDFHLWNLSGAWHFFTDNQFLCFFINLLFSYSLEESPRYKSLVKSISHTKSHFFLEIESLSSFYVNTLWFVQLGVVFSTSLGPRHLGSQGQADSAFLKKRSVFKTK